LEKVRVYELAKELNTTSKRLMEKLGEIDIQVKNHMSLLEEDELNALYKHIGIIKREEKAEDAEEKKAEAPAPVTPPVQRKQGVKRDAKSAPRIIRTTEIIINTQDGQDSRYDRQRADVRGGKNRQRNDYVTSTDANSGLLSGFVRKSRSDYATVNNAAKKASAANSEKPAANKKETAGMSADKKADSKVEAVKPDINEAVLDKAAMVKEDKPVITETVVSKKDDKPIMHDDKAKKKDTDKAEKEKKQETIADKSPQVASQKVDTKLDKKAKDADAAEDKATGKQDEKAQQARQPQAGESEQDPKPQEVRASESKELADKAQDSKTQDSKAQGGRPQGDRAYSKDNGQQAGRSAYQGSRPQGDRPQGDRSSYQGGRQQGGRPSYQGSRPQGDRSQGDRSSYQGSRQQGGRPSYQGSRPQGDRPPYQGNRPQGGAGYRKPLDIPKPDLTDVQKEELGSQRSENRREFISKDIDKGAKREQRKETPRIQTGKASRRSKTPAIDFSGKKGVSEVLSEDFILNEFYTDSGAKRKRPNRQRKGKEIPTKHIPPRAVLTSITVPEILTVKELAESLKKTSAEIIKKLMAYGMMATLNQEVDFETATIIAEEYGVKVEKAIIINDEDILFDDAEETDPDKLVTRPPVVVVMGHVDHGKTSLLDAIRSANVIESEAGGITQHIGAYTVKINDRNITFLDTPGHEAFTSMRARGAQVTDIAILVVAADDGVMPQTVEAINHAKAANVSIIVAINKIDKPGANPDRVKQELTQHGLVPEEWGGDVICVNVSAKNRENIDQLLEMVLLTADLLELKSDPNRQAKGTVIEAKLDKNRGSLATVLVQRGTLKVGDSIVTGATVGRIRAMVDDKGNPVKSAGPSEPVEILGLSDVPEAGELFYAIEDERVARHLAETRKFKKKEESMNITPKVSLDDLFKQIQEGNVKDLNLIIKADVQGSVEAVKQSLEKLTNEEVRVNVIHGGVGAITESDVVFADVSNAIIIGFNVRPGANVTDAAESAGVDIRLYSVIYNAIEDIEAAMKGMLDPTFKEVVTGHTEVRQIFKVSGVGTIAGCYVLDGKIARNSDVRIVRDGIVVHEGKLASLKRFKDDAKEVLSGFECGLSIERFNDIKEKDIVESYVMEEVKR